jgi:hypothetical protein
MRSMRYSLIMAALMATLIATTFASGAHAQSSGTGSGSGSGAAGAAGGGSSGSGATGGGPPRFVQRGVGDDSSSNCGGPLELPSPPADGDVGDAVKVLSRATEHYLQQCACATQACVADALDKYAEALAVIAPRLPRQLRDMPNIVARAARRVRAARTPAAAVAALGQAITVIHKEIALIQAEDAETYRRETRGGNFVAETLTVASLSLERGGGL